MDVKDNPKVKDCCRDPKNLVVISAAEAGVPQRDDMRVRRCAVCKCRHFDVDADAADFRFTPQ